VKRAVSTLLPIAVAPMLGGCVATALVGAAVVVAKAPFQVGGAVIDATTTSQAEADRNRGKAIRKQEEADAKAARQTEKARRKAEKAADEEVTAPERF
jgi:hypothetical protein